MAPSQEARGEVASPGTPQPQPQSVVVSEGVPPVEQAPAWQMPSAHVVPSGFAGLEQMPVVSQAPLSWQSSRAEQITGLAPMQAPLWHTSVCVQAFSSLHDDPSGLAGLMEHRPVAGLQVPASWHWSGAAQVTGLVPVQVPAWHVSPSVQALLSLHAVPFVTGGATHTPVLALHAAMAEPHADKRLSPLVCTGVFRLVVVVSPSWPKPLVPQAQTVPSDFNATVWT
jgi:hypothetical protein